MPTKVSRQILASAARTTTQVDRVRATDECTYLEALLNVTVNGAAGSITLLIEGWDEGAAAFYTLLQSAAIAAPTTGLTRLTIGPALPVTANVSANSPLPEKVRLTVTANNANAVTYSLGLNLS